MKTLARDLRGQRVMELTKSIFALKRLMPSLTGKELADARMKLAQLSSDLRDAEEFDWVEFAQGILDKMFSEFPVGSEYLQNCLTTVQRYGQLMSPIGRVRHLWRVFTGRRGVIAAAGRRAQNSPIQGFASEVGASAAFRAMREAFLWLRAHPDLKDTLSLDSIYDLMPRYCRAVHDCNVFLVPYAFTLVHLHIYCYVATTGIANWYRDVFDVEFTVIPEIEVEVFADESDSRKWDWRIPQLLRNLHDVLKNQVSLGFLPADELDYTWELVTYPWRSKKLRKELCTQYPILDVNVEDAIVRSMKEFKP